MGVVVGSRAVPGATGNFSVTGLPWQPVAVVFFNQHNHLGLWSMFLGAATADDEQWVIWTGTDTETNGYTHRKREGRTDRCCLSYIHGDNGTIAWAASLVSLNSDGFTLNLTERTTVNAGEGGNIYYMALGGDHITEAHAGTVTLGASTGTVAVTDPGFQPTALIVAHHSTTMDTGAQSTSSFGVGITDGSNQFASYGRVETGTAILARHSYRTDAISTFWDGTNAWRHELSSFDTNGFTLNVATAYQDQPHAYLAINADIAVAGNGIQPDATGTEEKATPGLKPQGVFFCWNGADSPSTTGATNSPIRPGIGAGTVSAAKMSSGISRVSAPFGVYTSDGFQIGTEPLGFWGTGIATDANSTDSQASATVSSVQDDSFTLNWSTIASPTPDRTYGWLALPGELTFLPQIYRRPFG